MSATVRLVESPTRRGLDSTNPVGFLASEVANIASSLRLTGSAVFRPARFVGERAEVLGTKGIALEALKPTPK